jgi:predicted nucleic acid-binding protein
MARVLLDTTILIDVLRGRPGAQWRLRQLRSASDIPFVCAISVEETARGLRPAERETATDLLRGLRAAPLGKDEGWQAGTWRDDYSRRGRTLAHADCLIAASALAIGGRLATGNPKHFPMRELSIEHWPAGE